MKKLYITLIFGLFFSNLKSQSYFPMLDSVSNVWHFTGNLIPIRQEGTASVNCDYFQTFGFESNEMYTTGDTSINGLTYQSITQSAFNWPGFDCVYGYIREDTATQKIYFMDNIFSPEEVIYDFSMVPGNTILLNFLQSNFYYQSGDYTLDSISSIQIPAGTRRLFHLSNHGVSSSPNLQWIESVGHPGHLVYTKSGNFWGGLFSFMCSDIIDRNFYQVLTCFEHDAQKVYFDSCTHSIAVNNGCFFYADSCNYWNICGGVEEHGAINKVQIAPNPFGSSTQLIIDANRFELTELIVYNTDGRFLWSEKINNIKPGKNFIPLDFPTLRTGMFFVEIRSGDNSQYLKIVKTGSNY